MLTKEERIEIRVEMLRRGVKPGYLSEKIGVKPSTLRNYLNGYIKISPTIEKYLRENGYIKNDN